MKLRSILDHTFCLVLAGGLSASVFLPASASARDGIKRAKKAEAAKQAGEAIDPRIKGHNVVKVTYKGPAKVQAFSQTAPKRWTSAQVAYQEVGRDEFSVYLVRAKNDKERVQIDLYTKQVLFSGQGTKATYPIVGASK